MTTSRHYVSLRTYALAFAVALSPAFFQTAYSCDRGNTELSNLEFEVGGQNLIQGFDYTVRSYAVSIDASAAVATLRATPRMSNSTVNWQWLVGGVGVDSGVIGVGGGEVPLLDIPPEGLSQLRVDVRAGAPGTAMGHYWVNVSRQDVFACTEQGILDAIAMGGGPHTFDCVGPTTVAGSIVIDNDVILDGEGSLTLEAVSVHGAFGEPVIAELRGFTLSASERPCCTCAGIPPYYICPIYCRSTCNSIVSFGTLTVTDGIVTGSGIWSAGPLTVTGSTATVLSVGEPGNLLVVNSTATAIYVDGGQMSMTSSTVAGSGASVSNMNGGTVTLANTIMEGECAGDPVASHGYNIESPGDTCGFDQGTDLVNVTPAELNLGPLEDNGGPTETHALLPGSFAIDWIPAVDCEVTEDQRGEPRPGGTMCDVGAFEVQP